jgi:DNA-binding response OmpR family regulator
MTNCRKLWLRLRFGHYVLVLRLILIAMFPPFESINDPRTVDVHVRRLRDAITQEGEPDVIHTVRTAGYALNIG